MCKRTPISIWLWKRGSQRWQCSVRNYRSPTRHWRLTFRVGDHQLATWSPKKKKEKEKKWKIEQSRIFRKEGGQIGSERSFFHSSASAASVWSRTKHGSRNSHVSRVDLREVLQSSKVQSLRSMCFPHVRLQDRQQRDNTTPCPNTHRPRNSKVDLRFLRCYVAKEGGRNQSGHSSFPFRFDRVYVRDTDCETLLSPVTCMRGATALISATSLSTRVVERPKRHNNSTILSQKKAGVSTAWASFRLGFDRLRDTDREAPTCHVHATVLHCTANDADVCRGDQAVARVAHVSALQMQRKAYFRYISCMCAKT